MKEQNKFSPIREKIEQIIFGIEHPREQEETLKSQHQSANTNNFEQDTAHVAFRSMN